MSGDQAQEYFADGMTEDIITDLSKISGLFVIARNSTFAYKGKAVNVREVAEDLGVRYVLEGSVRRSGDQVRINAQLIDATTGGHLWAERYDGSPADVFALQDKVTGKIVAALAVSLTARDRALQARVETQVPEAHDAFLRGWAYYRRNTPDDFAAAIPYFEQAIALDPDYTRAHAALAAIHWVSVTKNRTGRGGFWPERLGLSHEASRQLVNERLEETLDDPVPLTLQVASSLRSFQGRHEAAVAEATRAIELDGNDPVGYEALATALIYGGRPAEATEAIRKAMRLDPHYPSEFLVWLGLAQFGEERFGEAAESLRTATQRNPADDIGLILLAAAYGNLGREADAKSAIAALDDLRAKRKIHLEGLRAKGIEIGIDVFLPGPYTLEDVDQWPFKERADRERLRAGLKLAGVPATAKGPAESPTEVAGAITVDPAAAKALFDRGVPFVDVRTQARWDLGRVPGSVLLDLKTDFNEANLLEVAGQDEEVVIYCEGPKCLRASQACARAVGWGFTKVYYLRLGFPGWKSAGYEFEAG
jgi:TolB-like protein/rhodanese-related sulfurtransferase